MSCWKQYRTAIFLGFSLIILLLLANPARAAEISPENEPRERNGIISQPYGSSPGIIGNQHFPVNISPSYSFSEKGGDGLPLEAITVPIEAQVMAPPVAPRDASGHKYCSCIMFLLQEGLIQGYSDGSIRPDQEITRAETASLLVKSLGFTNPLHDANPYHDELPAWAADTILVAYEQGFMSGYPDKTFRPDQAITRSELCAALMKGCFPSSMEIHTFSSIDEESVPSWALSFVKSAAAGKTVVFASDQIIEPDRTLTRAEAFYLLCFFKGPQGC